MILRQIHAPLLSIFLILITFCATNNSVRVEFSALAKAVQPLAKPQLVRQPRQQQQHQVVGGNGSNRSVWSSASQNGTVTAGASAAGYLLAEATDQMFNQSSPIDELLASILSRTGPDMRPLRDFTDFDDITLEVAKRAWSLMRHHAQSAVSTKVDSVAPFIEQTLKAANVSGQCVDAALKTMDAARRLDSWAIQLLSSWGAFPPTGIYEGTFGDIGSFHGCVNVPENAAIGHAHYCTISYRPVMPRRKSYELIVRKEPDELLKLFNKKDAFTEILDNAQYSHYIYYKFGTCFPIKCTPNDVQRVAKLLGLRSILMSGPVKCHSKFETDYEEETNTTNTTSSLLKISTRDLNDGVYIWKPHITRTQWVALLLFVAITSTIVFLTLIDVALNRIPRLLECLAENERIRDIELHSLSVASSVQKAATATITRNKETDYFLAEVNSPSDDNDDEYYQTEESTSLREEPFSYVNNNFHELSNINSTSNKWQLKLSSERRRNSTSNSSSSSNHTTFKSSVSQEDGDGKLNLKRAKAVTAIVTGDDELKRKDDDKDKSNLATFSKEKKSLLMGVVDDYSIITNVGQFFQVSQGQIKNDILCINGIRCITMSWIIITHTMQYNDWSAFARTREIETHLKSLINQPLFNASYLVDTFFLISGLLTSFSSFNNKKLTRSNNEQTRGLTGNDNNDDDGAPATTVTTAAAASQATELTLSKFSSRAFLIGRYLRLTPQMMFVALLFILLPLISKSGGPHWYTITGEYSENCSQNWWINLLHIQAFYRSNEMCNFVCWWVSVDMFYHLFALLLISTILYYGHLIGLISCSFLILIYGVIQASKHYQMSLPPNLLSTIPQTGKMWSEMTLEFFWTPWAHAFPFFMGFYLGYLMAQQKTKLKAWFSIKRALLGWTLAIGCLFGISYSTHFWVMGKWQYSRLISTIFYSISSIIWSTCLAWIITACQFGYGGYINKLLSSRFFIVLGKASYVVYLSHFLVLFTFFGSQNLLLEPTQLVMLYVILGNICFSMLFGSLLCIVYEMPWLKTQKRLMKYVR